MFFIEINNQSTRIKDARSSQREFGSWQGVLCRKYSLSTKKDCEI
jgi:hypothetical protein